MSEVSYEFFKKLIFCKHHFLKEKSYETNSLRSVLEYLK